MYEVERYELGNKILSIYQDDCADDPRGWDNLGEMICWHRRYRLGDNHSFHSPRQFLEYLLGDRYSEDYLDGLSFDQLLERVEQHSKCLILPVFMYDHSGVALSTGSFIGRAHHAEWDSGQVGYIYIPYEKIRREYGVKRITQRLLDRVAQCLTSEVKIYSSYVNGEVYYYQIEDRDGEIVDSCGGFYGWDFEKNGMYEHIGYEWEEAM